MTVIKLINYIEKNAQNLKDIGIQVKRHLINEGDRYNNKLGILFELEIFGKKYSIGFYQETTDRESWKSAVFKLKSWCKKEDKYFPSKKLLNLVETYKNRNRDEKINNILK